MGRLWVCRIIREYLQREHFCIWCEKRKFLCRTSWMCFEDYEESWWNQWWIRLPFTSREYTVYIFLVHIYSRGAYDNLDIAQSFFEEEIPVQVPFFTKVSSSSFSQAVFFNRHSLSYVILSEAQTCFTALGHSWIHSHFSSFPLCFTQRENGEEHFLLQPKRWQCSRSF